MIGLTSILITDHNIGIKHEAGLQRQLHYHQASPPKLVGMYISSAL